MNFQYEIFCNEFCVMNLCNEFCSKKKKKNLFRVQKNEKIEKKIFLVKNNHDFEL